MSRLILLTIACGALSAAAHGQSVNIDVGDLAGPTAPDYGGAGLPGAWNVFAAAPGDPQPLVGLTGQPVAATATRDFGYALAYDDPGTSGDDQGLMDDGLGEVGDVQMTMWIDGLLDGTYEVLTYAWTPARPNDSTLVMVNDDLFTGLFWTGEKARDLGLVDDFGSAGFVARSVFNAEKIVDYTYRENLLDRFAKQIGVGAARALQLSSGFGLPELR